MNFVGLFVFFHGVEDYSVYRFVPITIVHRMFCVVTIACVNLASLGEAILMVYGTHLRQLLMVVLEVIINGFLVGGRAHLIGRLIGLVVHVVSKVVANGSLIVRFGRYTQDFQVVVHRVFFVSSLGRHRVFFQYL